MCVTLLKYIGILFSFLFPFDKYGFWTYTGCFKTRDLSSGRVGLFGRNAKIVVSYQTSFVFPGDRYYKTEKKFCNSRNTRTLVYNIQFKCGNCIEQIPITQKLTIINGHNMMIKNCTSNVLYFTFVFYVSITIVNVHTSQCCEKKWSELRQINCMVKSKFSRINAQAVNCIRRIT